MFDIGWSELMLIGIVALIVVGPKDLPVMFRALGRMTAKARAMAREFTRAMEDAAKESGLEDVSRDLRAAASAKSRGIAALERATERFEKWDPKLPGAAASAAAGKTMLEPDPDLTAWLDAAELEAEPEPDLGAPAAAASAPAPAAAPTAAQTTPHETAPKDEA